VNEDIPMTTTLFETLLVLVLLLNLAALGTSRILMVIRTVALQGVLLGLMPLLVHETISMRVALVSIMTMAMKGVVIPSMLHKAMRDAQIKREVEPFIGLIPSMLLGALATGLALALAQFLPLRPEHGAPLAVPASLATVLTGFLLLTTRLKAISQVLGYLVLENGIFIFGLLLLEAMPLLVEMGVLLDLLVAIFVMGIILNHISREFSSLDTRRLSALRD
jgi:hydrogenase-4 component E